MASVTTTKIFDDIDGKQADETIRFSLDGADYEIDLSKKNAGTLRKAMAEFVSAARPIKPSFLGATNPPRRTGRVGRAASAGARSPKAELDAIRAWAKSSGVQVADRGRISQHVRELYAAR